MEKPDLSAMDIRKPDAQGRISIGREHANETYAIERRSNGDIVLRPVAVIHQSELWLFENRPAYEAVKRGLAQSASGDTVDKGSFAAFASEDPED